MPKQKKRGKSGQGEEAADSYLITVWMPAMNQKICFVPTDSFVLRPPPPAGQLGHGWTDQKNAQRTGAALPYPTQLIPSLSTIYFCLSSLSLSSSFVSAGRERKIKKQVQEKGKERFAGDIGQQISSRTWQALGRDQHEDTLKKKLIIST